MFFLEEVTQGSRTVDWPVPSVQGSTAMPAISRGGSSSAPKRCFPGPTVVEVLSSRSLSRPLPSLGP